MYETFSFTSFLPLERAERIEIGMLLTSINRPIFISDRLDKFDNQREYAKQLVDKYSNYGQNVAMSVGVYGRVAELATLFKEPFKKNDYFKVIENLENPKEAGDVSKALEAASTNMFSSKEGSKKKSRKILVMFVEEELSHAVNSSVLQQLRDKNVEIAVVMFSASDYDRNAEAIVSDKGLAIYVDQHKKIDLAKIIDDTIKKGRYIHN